MKDKKKENFPLSLDLLEALANFQQSWSSGSPPGW